MRVSARSPCISGPAAPRRRCCTGRKRCLRRWTPGLPRRDSPSGACGPQFRHRRQQCRRPDLGALRDPRPRIHDCGGMDGHASGRGFRRLSSLSASLHITSTSATSWPSTVAFPAIFATLAFRLTMVISMRSVSPGTPAAGSAHNRWQRAAPAWLARSGRIQHQHPGRLRHGFHNQHARHHREVGKVAMKKGSLKVTFLIPTNALGLHFDNPVHQQKRIAVGQDRPDFVDIQNSHESAIVPAGG